MTAAELIEKLQQFPEDTIVRVAIGYDEELYESVDLIPHTDGSVSLV